ncbi:MAG: hypothetical protein IID18_00220 [Nitrospinae bacterium]|nr:hypothetical protein [Nitrospinota bacterium]
MNLVLLAGAISIGPVGAEEDTAKRTTIEKVDAVTGKITKEDIELKFNDKETSQKSISNYLKKTYYTLGWDVDYAVPYSPAFAILGLSPTEVLPSNTAREFASSIINAADKNGNFQQGVAIDTSLMNMFGRRLTFEQYNANNLSRFVYRTRVSFAVTKGQEESDKSTRLALGFVFTPV